MSTNIVCGCDIRQVFLRSHVSHVLAHVCKRFQFVWSFQDSDWLER